MRRGNTLVIIIILAVVVLLLLALVLIPFAMMGRLMGGGLDRPTGLGVGCFIPDEYFGDMSAVSRKEEIVSALGERWAGAKTNEAYIRELFDRAAKEGINPLIPLSIWAGEQGFRSPEKAFGWGFTDSRTLSGVRSWEVQLDGVFKAIRNAISATGYYVQPQGTNSFTRLFYNYTTAMRYIYENSGNSWNEEAVYTDGSKPLKIRLSVFRLVAPNQISCGTGVLVASTSGAGALAAGAKRVGNDGVPLFIQGDYPQPYSYRIKDGMTIRSTIARAGCCTASAAMVLSYYGLNVDPVSISKISDDKGYYAIGRGTNHGLLFPYLAKKYGMGIKTYGGNSDRNWNNIINHLKNGQPVIARGKGGSPYTQGGHCIVLTGYNEATNEIRVNDPARGSGSFNSQRIENLTTVAYVFIK